MGRFYVDIVNKFLVLTSCPCALQAAMCYVHVAALVAEYLRRKGECGVAYVSLTVELEAAPLYLNMTC